MVSILVPVYKVEAYLQRCIDSVLAQDFTDWEMILVDDGSPDRCPEICDEAARKDDRIRVVHKENGGLPSARLAGFEQAKGEYLVFLDSDDWLLPNALKTLFDAITSNGGYDVVKFRPMRENCRGGRWQESYEINEGEIFETEKYIFNLLHNKISPYLHSTIYRKSLFADDDFRRVIENGISIGEDWVLNMLISPKVRRFKAVNESVYIYYWNNSSMMTTTIMSPRLNDRVNKALDVFYQSSSEKICHERDVKEVVGLIRAFFVYEIPYNTDWYKRVIEFLQDEHNRRDIQKHVEWRFLCLINNEKLFHIYSRLYSLFKFVRNQKCRRRIVYPDDLHD